MINCEKTFVYIILEKMKINGNLFHATVVHEIDTQLGSAVVVLENLWRSGL